MLRYSFSLLKFSKYKATPGPFLRSSESSDLPAKIVTRVVGKRKKKKDEFH